MKKFLFVVMLTISSMLSFAGIIMTSSNERLEDVTIASETDSAIVYIQDGVEKSIAIEQVSAILYDNGTYKELVNESNKPSQDVTDNLGNVALIHLDKKAYDIDNIDKIDLDMYLFLSSAEQKILKLMIKQINDLKGRKQTPANQSKILGRKVYVATYLQSRASGLNMLEAEKVATKHAYTAIRTGYY